MSFRVRICQHPGCKIPANASGYCPVRHDPDAIASRQRAYHGIGEDARRARDNMRRPRRKAKA